jgi:DNA-binding XRE family transcriptional regulator
MRTKTPRSKTLNEVLDELSPSDRKRVEARAAELITEEMTLRDLRRVLKMTQTSMAVAIGVGQESISKLENRGDLRVSTLRKAVEALGGSLSLIVNFPDKESVRLAGIADAKPKAHRRK